LDDFAVRFQSEGFAVLLYDNRNWGASDGHPRQEVDPWRQVEDVHDAVAYVKTLEPQVDASRIVLWGTSYSGGNVVIAAAIDHRVKAVISQVAFVSGESMASNFSDELKDAIYANRVHGATPKYVPLFVDSLEVAQSDAKGKPMLGTEDSFHYFEKISAKNKTHQTRWENEVSLQSFYHMLKNEPLNYVHRIAPRPFLMVIAKDDALLNPRLNFEMFDRAGEGKELLILEGGHFDAYYGDAFERNVNRQIEFLKKHS
jgi:hypothetical protein